MDIDGYVADITGQIHAGFPDKNRETAEDGVRQTARALQAAQVYAENAEAFADGDYSEAEMQADARAMGEALVVGAKGLIELDNLALRYRENRLRAATQRYNPSKDEERQQESKQAIMERVLSAAGNDYGRAVELAAYREDRIRDAFGETPVEAAEAYCKQEGLVVERDDEEQTFVEAAREVADRF